MIMIVYYIFLFILMFIYLKHIEQSLVCDKHYVNAAIIIMITWNRGFQVVLVEKVVKNTLSQNMTNIAEGYFLTWQNKICLDFFFVSVFLKQESSILGGIFLTHY